ncbi:MAG: hypothetical protein A2096_02250 [Spirochaetes bacterium GWF1_41_5]|nr:MAG: hypothetical protein A2096_02250 [Spirochaetes bacterium GWF1_41_5]HBE04389.1 hypothetical protein [Spirochaetia bacterium]
MFFIRTVFAGFTALFKTLLLTVCTAGVLLLLKYLYPGNTGLFQITRLDFTVELASYTVIFFPCLLFSFPVFFSPGTKFYLLKCFIGLLYGAAVFLLLYFALYTGTLYAQINEININEYKKIFSAPVSLVIRPSFEKKAAWQSRFKEKNPGSAALFFENRLQEKFMAWAEFIQKKIPDAFLIRMAAGFFYSIYFFLIALLKLPALKKNIWLYKTVQFNLLITINCAFYLAALR